MNKLIDIIVGARPNFIKVAAIINEIKIRFTQESGIRYRLIHTSQHYDTKMSGVFFEELNMPSPDINLNVGNVKSSEQISTIIARYSKVLEDCKPDMVIVSGDVNSTVACALATKKTYADIPLVHVEAGLRCGDRHMPEEINRILTDSISDYFFTTSRRASDNLVNESVHPNKIYFVGNTMIDTLYNNEKRFRRPSFWTEFDLEHKKYYTLTLHRQANISDPSLLAYRLEMIGLAAGDMPVIFPVHPHTAKIIAQNDITLPNNIITTEPMGYLEFNYLVKNSFAVITDSGGISEETTVMNVPCITLRGSTERPETCEIGTNVLVDDSPELLFNAFEKLKNGTWQLGRSPELWDGKAAERIVNTIFELLTKDRKDKYILMSKQFPKFGDIKYNTIFLN